MNLWRRDLVRLNPSSPPWSVSPRTPPGSLIPPDQPQSVIALPPPWTSGSIPSAPHGFFFPPGSPLSSLPLSLHWFASVPPIHQLSPVTDFSTDSSTSLPITSSTPTSKAPPSSGVLVIVWGRTFLKGGTYCNGLIRFRFACVPDNR